MTKFSEFSPTSLPDRQRHQSGAEQPASTEPESPLAAFARSVVYSGVEAPLQGVAQIVDVCAGTEWAHSDMLNFVKPAGQSKFGSVNWMASTAGSAIGMILPFKLVGAGTRSVFGLEAAEGAVPLGMSMKESMATGFAYESIFRPNDTKPKNFSDLLSSRLVNGAGGALTFGTLTLAGGITGGVLKKELAASPILGSAAVGAISGVPAGFVSTEFESRVNKGRWANSSELAESILNMSFVGGAFGAVHGLMSEKPAGQNNESEHGPVRLADQWAAQLRADQLAGERPPDVVQKADIAEKAGDEPTEQPAVEPKPPGTDPALGKGKNEAANEGSTVERSPLDQKAATVDLANRPLVLYEEPGHDRIEHFGKIKPLQRQSFAATELNGEKVVPLDDLVQARLLAHPDFGLVKLSEYSRDMTLPRIERMCGLAPGSLRFDFASQRFYLRVSSELPIVDGKVQLPMEQKAGVTPGYFTDRYAIDALARKLNIDLDAVDAVAKGETALSPAQLREIERLQGVAANSFDYKDGRLIYQGSEHPTRDLSIAQPETVESLTAPKVVPERHRPTVEIKEIVADLGKLDYEYKIDGETFKLKGGEGPWLAPEDGRSTETPAKLRLIVNSYDELMRLQEVLIPKLMKDPELKKLIGSWKTRAPFDSGSVKLDQQSAKGITIYPAEPGNLFMLQERLDRIIREELPDLVLDKPAKTNNMDSVRGQANRIGIARDVYEPSPDSKTGQVLVKMDDNVRAAAESDPRLSSWKEDSGRLSDRGLRALEEDLGMKPGILRYDSQGNLVMEASLQKASHANYHGGVYLAEDARDPRMARNSYGAFEEGYQNRTALFKLYERYGVDPIDSLLEKYRPQVNVEAGRIVETRDTGGVVTRYEYDGDQLNKFSNSRGFAWLRQADGKWQVTRSDGTVGVVDAELEVQPDGTRHWKLADGSVRDQRIDGL